MATTKQQQSQDDADFAEQFNKPDEAPKTQTEDEAFGLTPETNDDTGDKTGAADAGAGDDAAGAAAAAPGADAGAGTDDAQAKETALQERSAALDAREAELTAREAAMQTSNTNDVQTSSDDQAGKGKDGGDGGKDESTESQDDPRAALAEDFGPEFIEQMTKFIKLVVEGSVKDSLNPLQSTIQSVIDDLQNERRNNHFKTIKAAHEDFMDIVESPEFTSWVEGLPDAEKTDTQRVIQSGSADEIVAMLTKFKKSKEVTSGGDAGTFNDDSADQLDAAEGVRSSGLRLPDAPKDTEDYAKAWNAA